MDSQGNKIINVWRSKDYIVLEGSDWQLLNWFPIQTLAQYSQIFRLFSKFS